MSDYASLIRPTNFSQFVIPDIFNRESRVFSFSFVRKDNDTGSPIRSGMTEEKQKIVGLRFANPTYGLKLPQEWPIRAIFISVTQEPAEHD